MENYKNSRVYTINMKYNIIKYIYMELLTNFTKTRSRKYNRNQGRTIRFPKN